MKEQEKGDGSDGKESLKTKSDESGEEKNGDDDNQKSAQKKKGKAGPGGTVPWAQPVSLSVTHRWKHPLPSLGALLQDMVPAWEQLW